MLRLFCFTLLISAGSLPLQSATGAWQLGPCGRGGLCPGDYTPLPTPTNTATPDPSAPTPTPWPTATASPTPLAGAYSLRVDIGSAQAYVDGLSQTWAADQVYSAGSWGSNAASAAYSSAAEAAGTSDPALYATLRQASDYQFKASLANGDYRVVLHFAELTAQAAGQRVMQFVAEGTTVNATLDVFAAVGGGRAYTFSSVVTVSDGQLDLDFGASAGKAMLAAVEVYGLQVPGVPTPTVTPTELPLTLQLDLPIGARLLEQP